MGLNDFAGFDKSLADALWGMKVRREGSSLVTVVFAFGHTWFDARRLGQTFFNVCFDAVTGSGGCVDERKASISRWSVVLLPDPTGGVEAFETTRSLRVEEVRRGEGLRKWEPVARQGGRENRDSSGGVQENGQEAIHPDEGDAPGPPDPITQVRKKAGLSTGDRSGKVGGHKMGPPRTATRGRR